MWAKWRQLRSWRSFLHLWTRSLNGRPCRSLLRWSREMTSILEHSSYWSIKWYGWMARFDINQGLGAPPQSRQWSIHGLGDTNTCGNRNVLDRLPASLAYVQVGWGLRLPPSLLCAIIKNFIKTLDTYARCSAFILLSSLNWLCWPVLLTFCSKSSFQSWWPQLILLMSLFCTSFWHCGMKMSTKMFHSSLMFAMAKKCWRRLRKHQITAAEFRSSRTSLMGLAATLPPTRNAATSSF